MNKRKISRTLVAVAFVSIAGMLGWAADGPEMPEPQSPTALWSGLARPSGCWMTFTKRPSS